MELIFAYIGIFFAVALFTLAGYRIFRSRALSIKDKYMRRVSADLDYLYSEIQATRVFYFTVISVVVSGLLGFLLTKGNVILAILFAIVGIFLPRIYIWRQKQKRLEKFEEQLVDALDLISGALQAGLSITQAIAIIVKEMSPPISQEFDLVIREERLGVKLQEGLERMTKRVRSNELEMLVTAINIAIETGGNLSEVIERIARTMRDRSELKGKIKALTAESRFQGIFVGALPLVLAFLLNLMDPELMYPMFHTLVGYILIGIVVILEIAGFLVTKKLTQIEY